MLSAITWDIDPYLVHFGDGGLRWYGLLWAIGIYVGWLLIDRMFKHEHCPENWSTYSFFYITIGAFIGSRLGHCLFYGWQDGGNPYIEHPLRILEVWKGGMSSHGSAVGMMIAAWLLNKYKFSRHPEYKTSWIWIIDRLGIALCATGACIRFGNLMNSEVYGNPTDLPWGFIFARNGETVPCHPTQIYEILTLVIALVILLYLYWKKDAGKREGMLAGLFGVMVFGSRFLIEFIKNDQEAFEAEMALNMGQILSIPIVLLGIYFIIRSYKKAKGERLKANGLHQADR